MNEQKMSATMVATVVALCVFGAAIIWLNRYESGAIGVMSTRLDRFTGQVIGCLPNAGCIELVPAGAPTLREAIVRRQPAPTATPEAAAPAATEQKAQPKAEAPAKSQ
jgi:hypothetical protein